MTPPPLGDYVLLGDLKGSRTALLLGLDAGDLAVLHEDTESSAHLLSGATELRSHLLIGDGVILLGELLEDVRTELLNLEVHLGLAGTSLSALDLVDLLLAELNDLNIVSEEGSDAGVEVLLGGLGLGHDFLLSGTRGPGPCYESL